MGKTDQLVDAVILDAVNELKSKAAFVKRDIVTVALYYDCENKELLVCSDTLENSNKNVRAANAFSEKYFHEAIAEGDLGKASLWVGLTGRSLSLGDFVNRNLARTPVPTALRRPTLFVALARGLIRNSDLILEVCNSNEQIVFATSTEDNEVGLVWIQRDELAGDVPSNTGQREREDRSLFSQLFSKK